MASSAALLSPAGAKSATTKSSSRSRSPDVSSRFDLLIQGGTLVDPGQGLHGPFDVAVKDGKIAAVAKDIPADSAMNVFNVRGRLVTPGFIDVHVHCYDGVGHCVDADHACLNRGVTTVIDAGSAGCENIANFHKYIVRTASTRIYPLVDIGMLGVISLNHPYDNPAWVKPKEVAQAIEHYRPSTVGVKVRLAESIEGAKDIYILKKAIEAAEMVQTPVMVHINAPHSPLPDILKLMRKGDIYTHCFAGLKNFILDGNGKVLPAAWEAKARGVLFDPAQGQAHFSFDVAEKCLQQNFFPDTISTDMSKMALQRRIFDLPTMVSKFMALGVGLDRAISMVTVNPTKMFAFDVKIGALRPGYEADIGIFELQEGNFEFEDSRGEKRAGRQRLVNKAVVSRGSLLVNEV